MENANYPIEYEVGEVEFFGKKFHITPDVLIPRLETEGLVRRARKILGGKEYKQILDIGTGSGIIGVSLGDLVEKIVFTDISEKALEVAKSNFFRYFPREKGGFIVSDLLSNRDIFQLFTSPVLILANLPYIKNEDWIHMSEDTRYEPKLALFGGKTTGFEMYERLFEQIRLTIPHIAYSTSMVIEFGFDQRDIAEQVIKNYGWKYEFFADYSGIERFCEINLTN